MVESEEVSLRYSLCGVKRIIDFYLREGMYYQDFTRRRSKALSLNTILDRSELINFILHIYRKVNGL